MHLSAELEWAQFLVIMVVGFMLLYDCVLNRKSARKLEGLLGPDGVVDETSAKEGMSPYKSDIASAASNIAPGQALRFAVAQGQSDLASKENMLGGMRAPHVQAYAHEAESQRSSDVASAQTWQQSAEAAASEGNYHIPAPVTEGMESDFDKYLKSQL